MILVGLAGIPHSRPLLLPLTFSELVSALEGEGISMTNRPVCATVSTAARIAPVDGSHHRLHAPHRCMLVDDGSPDLSHEVRASTWNVSLHLHTSEGGNGVRRHQRHTEGDSGGHIHGGYERSSRGPESEYNLFGTAGTRRSRRPPAR